MTFPSALLSQDYSYTLQENSAWKVPWSSRLIMMRIIIIIIIIFFPSNVFQPGQWEQIMGPLLFHGTASNGKKLDTNHTSALTCCDSGICKDGFFWIRRFSGRMRWLQLWCLKGGGKRFVDQLTRIFERQLFFRNLYQSFQLRNKKAAHLQYMWYDFFRSQPYSKAEPEKHKTPQ